MLIREEFEKNEHMLLSKYASFSDESRGRDRWEEPCDIRTDYQRDRDRIIHCKSFRRLKHKTQVFLSPGGDHYRTRLTHTLEVSQIARTIAKALHVNEDLTEAIALGHDLGHTPFGHAGERALSKAMGMPFRHNEQSVRVVEKLEKDGRGLNLTWEVRDGIRNHKTSGKPATLEGDIVRVSDKIAYINHDIDDGIRAGILTEEDLPSMCTYILGHSTRDRINSLIHDAIRSSTGQSRIQLSPEYEEALFNLRKFMFAYLYTNPVAKGEESKAEEVVVLLYQYYLEHTDEMPEEYRVMMEAGEDKNISVCDYIAGMSDNYAIDKFQEIYIPRTWSRM
jgi:dGTPase